MPSEMGGFLNNADWLLSVNYIDFLRDIGKHFRVNEMIRAEGYRQRLERELGLSFLEFNYQLLQAYDYLRLFQKYGCRLQLGGDDQWGNILAGVDLVRRVEGERVHAVTFPLLTTASGAKMGKTAGVQSGLTLIGHPHTNFINTGLTQTTAMFLDFWRISLFFQWTRFGTLEA